MNNTQNDLVREGSPAMLDRRKFLIAGAGVAAVSLLPHVSLAAQVQPGQNSLGVTGRTVLNSLRAWVVAGSAHSRYQALGSACRT